VQGHTIAIGGNTALDPFRKPAINLQREGSLAFRDGSSSPLLACGAKDPKIQSTIIVAESRARVVR
jgi:hypothetical protein